MRPHSREVAAPAVAPHPCDGQIDGVRLTSLPLERKLPLLITGLLAAVLLVAIVSTWRMRRESAELAAGERLERAAEGIAASARLALEERARTLRAAARDPALISAVRSGDTSRIAARLGELKPAADPHALEFQDRSGNRVAWAGDDVAGAERGSAFAWTNRSPLVGLPGDSVVYSPLYEWGGETRFWGVTPVTAGGSRLGYLAHQRRAGGAPGSVESLRGLLGEDVTLLMRNGDGAFWSTATVGSGGRPARRDTTVRGIHDILPNGDRMLAAEAPVEGTDWLIVLQATMQDVLAPARTTLVRLLLVGAVLALVGAVAAWAISRRIVHPLTSLTVAAEAMAHGEYDRRVDVSGDDEVGRLAVSFNQMANEVAAARDALERRTREAEAAREDAERANRAKADFLAVMSHELRTPLNAIGGYADLLNLGIYGTLSEEQRDALGRIARNQEHLLALINDILNFARIDAGQVQFDIQDIPLQEVLIGIEPLIAPQLRARQLEFVCTLDDPHVTALADGEKLRQILLNLLTNAIKFTPPGGRISLEGYAAGDRALIRVADTGPGIPRDRLPTIFEPFVQADRALNRPHEGVGLGLAISRDLARGMGGSLTAESEVGQGATFTVALPRGRAPQLTPPHSQPAVA